MVVSRHFACERVKPKQGFEPWTPCLQGRRSDQLSYFGVWLASLTWLFAFLFDASTALAATDPGCTRTCMLHRLHG
jgi:hypothetical protein